MAPEENTEVRREVRLDPRERRPRSPGWGMSSESRVGNGCRCFRKTEEEEKDQLCCTKDWAATIKFTLRANSSVL